MTNRKPAFLITMDTEGDNLWSRPAVPRSENAKFLPRFQSLCERYGFKPTWLTNWEMANCETFVDFGRSVLKRHAGEIGMHLHAWDTPPLCPLGSNDSKHHPYLFEFPESLMRAKIQAMTELLEDRFDTRIVSHRAGRWGFTSAYARLLVEFGYLVDCSVTPGVSWVGERGNPRGSGGCDFTDFPARPYFLNLEDIRRAGNSTLLEVPVSIVKRYKFSQPIEDYMPLVRRYVTRVYPPVVWLRPSGRNLKFMLELLDQARAEGWPCVEFMLHSSELMPGGGPVFGTVQSIEKLYADLEALFEAARPHFEGLTMSQFHESWISRGGSEVVSQQPISVAQSQ